MVVIWWYCVLKRISQTRLRGYVTDGFRSMVGMYADPHLSDTTRLFSTKEQRFPQISFRERHGGIAQLGERLKRLHTPQQN